MVRQTGSAAALLPPRAAADTSAPELSTDALSFIQDLLLSPSPQLGHALITALTVHGSLKHLSSNEALQLLYLNCLNKALKQLRWAELDTSSSHDSQYESDHTLEGGVYGEARRLEQYVYDLLSYLDVSAEMTGLSGKVGQIFLTLLGDPATPEPVWRFDPGTIYSCLVGRRTPYLVTCLHEVERYLYQQMGVGKEYVAMGNLTTAGAGTEGPEGAPPSSVAMEWKLLYHDALYSKKHLLQSVMVTRIVFFFVSAHMCVCWSTCMCGRCVKAQEGSCPHIAAVYTPTLPHRYYMYCRAGLLAKAILLFIL